MIPGADQTFPGPPLVRGTLTSDTSTDSRSISTFYIIWSLLPVRTRSWVQSLRRWRCCQSFGFDWTKSGQLPHTGRSRWSRSSTASSSSSSQSCPPLASPPSFSSWPCPCPLPEHKKDWQKDYGYHLLGGKSDLWRRVNDRAHDVNCLVVPHLE